MLKKVILLTISVKIFTFLLIIIGFYTLPFNTAGYLVNFRYPEKNQITLQDTFKTWDAQHYLYLSEQGYKPNNDSNAFYPLFPFLIHLLSPLFYNSLYAGLFLSNLLSIIGIIYFYLFVKDYFKKSKTAFSGIILLLIFPTSFYLSLAYSESLCFFLTILFFYFLYRNQFLYAGIFALLLPLSRPTGIFIIFPYVFYTLRYLYLLSPKLSWRFFLSLSPLLGLLVYFSIIYFSTSSIASGVIAASHFASGWKITNIFHPAIFLKNLFSPLPAQHVFINSGVDRGFFILFAISLYFIYKKLDKTLFIYALTVGSVPLFGSFMSYSRYLLLVFPLFMVLSPLLESKSHRFYKFLILSLIGLLQILFILAHSLNYWIS